MLGLVSLFQGRVRSDYQVTYPGGSFVRRVERRRVEWYINGELTSERQAKAFMQGRRS